MDTEKNHFKFWQIRKAIAILAVVVSAFCANSFNLTIILVWIGGVVVPIVILFLTSNDGDETEFVGNWLRKSYNKFFNLDEI